MWILSAFAFTFLAGDFEGKGEQIFEGMTMLIGAFRELPTIGWNTTPFAEFFSSLDALGPTPNDSEEFFIFSRRDKYNCDGFIFCYFLCYSEG